MTPDLADRVRALLATASDERPVGARAEVLCEQLSQHMSRLVGETGVQTLMNRAIHLASASFPWLAANPTPAARTSARLRGAMEQQSSEVALEGFVLVMSTFVGLLERLIGAGLVARLLHEVWPSAFRNPEETT